MEQGEPDFPTPNHIVQASISALRDGWTHYPPSAGLLELREAISRKLKTQNQIDADPRKEILVTTGAAQAIFCAFSTLLNPGDEVLIQTPAFPSFQRCASFFDAKPVEIPLDEHDGFSLSASAVSKAISDMSKLLVIKSPCNPTGAVATPPQLRDIADLVERTNPWVLTDEIYEKILFDDAVHVSLASLPGIRERTISVSPSPTR